MNNEENLISSNTEEKGYVSKPEKIKGFSFTDIMGSIPGESLPQENSEEEDEEKVNLPSEDNEKLKKSKKPKLEVQKEEELIDSEEKEETVSQNIIDEEKERLRKQVADNKKFAQQQRMANVTAKKKLTDQFQRMLEENIIFEEDLKPVLDILETSFSKEAIEEELTENEEKAKVQSVYDKLVAEKEAYKRYNKKDTEVEDKYNAFFQHLALLSTDKVEEIRDYLISEEPAEGLLYILSEGERYYNTLYKPTKKDGNILNYVENLQKKVNLLTEENKKLKKELDSTENEVYTSTIKSRANVLSSDVNNGDVTDFYMGKIQ